MLPTNNGVPSLPRGGRNLLQSKNNRIILVWPEDAWTSQKLFFNWGWCWLNMRSTLAPAPLGPAVRHRQHPSLHPPFMTSQTAGHSFLHSVGGEPETCFPRVRSQETGNRNARRQRPEGHARSYQLVKRLHSKSREPLRTSEVCPYRSFLSEVLSRKKRKGNHRLSSPGFSRNVPKATQRDLQLEGRRNPSSSP